MLPYRPIICAPPPKEWTLHETLYKSDRKTPLARIKAILPQQAFCPDESVELDLEITCIPSDLIVSYISYLFKKHYDGKLRLQRGTAAKSSYRSILQANVGVTGNDGTVRMPIRFQMPSRLVSPSFASKHIRVYYNLIINIHFESLGSLLKNPPTSHSSLSLSPSQICPTAICYVFPTSLPSNLTATPRKHLTSLIHPLTSHQNQLMP